jgi:hypothetical protein
MQFNRFQRRERRHQYVENESPDKVGLKFLIRLLDDIDTEKQNCYADLWMGAYTSIDDSATRAFQMAYSQEYAEQLFDDKTKRKPAWHICLLSCSEQCFVYQSRNLPTVRDFGDGTFYERQHVQCRLSQEMHLGAFPFDNQELVIRVSLDVCSRNAIFDESRIKVDLDTSFLFVQKAEWEFQTDRMYYTVESQQFGEDSYPRFSVHIPIRRNPKIYILNIVSPLVIVTCCTFFTLYVGSVAERLGFLSTLMLTVFTLKWSSFEKLPKISYLCFLDWLLLAGYVYIVFCMTMTVWYRDDVQALQGHLIFLGMYVFLVVVLIGACMYFQHSETQRWKEKKHPSRPTRHKIEIASRMKRAY